jgi:hypothetical protein
LPITWMILQTRNNMQRLFSSLARPRPRFDARATVQRYSDRTFS